MGIRKTQKLTKFSCVMKVIIKASCDEEELMFITMIQRIVQMAYKNKGKFR